MFLPYYFFDTKTEFSAVLNLLNLSLNLRRVSRIFLKKLCTSCLNSSWDNPFFNAMEYIFSLKGGKEKNYRISTQSSNPFFVGIYRTARNKSPSGVK